MRLDLRGLKCPLPVLRARKALKQLATGELLVIECTDPLASIDIPHLAHEMGDSLEADFSKDGIHIFHIRRLNKRETP